MKAPINRRGLPLVNLDGYFVWDFWGYQRPMGFTTRDHAGTPFPRNPMMVGCVGFSTTSKNQHTPLESCGTRLRAVFAVCKQHTRQVKPVWCANGKPLFHFTANSFTPPSSRLTASCFPSGRKAIASTPLPPRCCWWICSAVSAFQKVRVPAVLPVTSSWPSGE